MGKIATLTRDAMIDTSAKQTAGMAVDKGPRRGGCRVTHRSENLPTNIIESDSEDYEEDNSSEDDNENFSDNGLLMMGDRKLGSADQVASDFDKMTLGGGEAVLMENMRKLLALVERRKETETTGTKPKALGSKHSLAGLKARSPYRNRLNEHNHKPFERHDLVTAAHGNGGRVFVQSLTPVVPEPVENLSSHNALLDAIMDKDFIASFKKITPDQAEKVFLKFIEPERNGEFHESNRRVVSQDMAVPQMSPHAGTDDHSHSPNNLDMYDSSYETGSPGSTVVTSPGSPGQPRSSVSSESDQELDPAMETQRSQLPQTPQNILVIPVTVMPKSEPQMKPLGEVVNYNMTSASQRLYELSQSTSFCSKHFTIQLVRVFMTARADNLAERVKEFTKSLMCSIKAPILNKQHEADIWQLSIYAHIQFLTAPDRMLEYRPALKCRDEYGHSLLYIAAIQRHEKPLIARYIVESMSVVGFNPSEPIDDSGNSVLHVVAEQGDSHVQVLSELLMATGPNKQPLLSVLMTNALGQTPLHVATLSSRPQLTTLLLLLKMRAQPFDLDHCQMSPLHYYVRAMTRRGAHTREDVEVVRKDHCQMSPLHYYVRAMTRRGAHTREEVEVVRKMLQAPMSLNKESLQILEQVISDPSTPADITSLIGEEINRNCSKDLRPRKERR